MDPGAELSALLTAHDGRTDIPDEHEICGMARALETRIHEAGLEPSSALSAEVMAFRFCENYPNERSGWGTYYGPMASFSHEQGDVLEVPSIKDVTAETLAYWSRRAREANHPILRFRYGDLAWELAPKVNASRDPEGARIAIDAALELAGRPDAKGLLGRKKLTRALQLARSLKDSERVGQVRDAMIVLVGRTAEDSKVETWAYCFDHLVAEQVPLQPGQEERIISDLEARLARLAGGGDSADPWSAKDAAHRLATYYRRKGSEDDIRRVLLVAGRAFEELAKTAMPMVGAAWMRDVYDLYREFGLTRDAEALDPMLAELGEKSKGDLRRVSHEVEIPRETFDELARGILADDLSESLTRIAVNFLVDPEEAEQDVLRLAKQSPIQAIFKQVYLDARGRPESEVGSVEDDLQGRVVAQMRRRIGFEAVFLRHVLRVVLQKFAPSATVLTDCLFQSPVFEAPQRGLVERAMRAYLDGDWAAFAHLVVPQLEQAIRALVVKLGGSHLAPHRGGGLRLRPLDDLLRDSKLEPVLGPKVGRYLQVVLTDQRGLSLRNAVCHGYVPAEQFGTAMADRLFHVELVLGQLRAASRPDSGS